MHYFVKSFGKVNKAAREVVVDQVRVGISSHPSSQEEKDKFLGELEKDLEDITFPIDNDKVIRLIDEKRARRKKIDEILAIMKELQKLRDETDSDKEN